jgi:hypothetical protein
MSGMRRLGTPKPVSVRVGPGGVPLAVGRDAVDAVAEEWVVEDRWWTGRPIKRRYFELVLADGRNTVVFRDLRAEPAAAAPASAPAGPASDPAWPGSAARSARSARSARDGGFVPARPVPVAGSAPAARDPATPPPATGRWFSQVG